MERKEFYRNMEVGDTFVVLRNGKKCVKTENGTIYLGNGMNALLFPTTEVRKIVK